MKNKLISLAVGAFTLIALPASSALAWTYGLSGSGQCQSDGSFKITWSVDNTSENEALHITASSNSAVVATGTNIAAHSAQAFTQTASGTAAGSFSLSLTGNFPSDQTLRDRQATVTLSSACPQTGGHGGEDEDKVTLCHATDSNTNPYVRITVASSGAYHGHYKEHKGPVYPGSGGKWGDIIPPFTFDEHSYSLNWDTVGQTIFNNGCVLPTGGNGGETPPPVTPTTSVTPTGGQGGGSVVSTAAATTTQMPAPVGGVGAGFGGGSSAINASSLLGLVSSLSLAGFGLRKLGKQQG
jgi:hypothetical protein